MTTDVRQAFLVASARGSRYFPGLARKWRYILLSGDAAVTFFVSIVVLSQAPNRIAAAFVASAAICGTFALCGFYRRSYAVFPRDEIYYACTGLTFAAIPTAVILAAVGQVDLLSIAVALFFCAVGTSAWRVRAHLARRGEAAPYAGVSTITPYAWHDRESTGYLALKRCFDVTIAALVLIPASCVMLIAGIAVAAESGAPVLFKQERVGRNGRRFTLLKFRTMRPNAGAEWARPGDSRITGVGSFLRRTSIDELPQLFNVLRGEMSIVGPRPEMTEFAGRFSLTIPSYEQRHVVSPGITGWAQLYGKRNMEPDDVNGILPYDLFYVERASIVLDTAIVFKTAAEVLFHRAV